MKYVLPILSLIISGIALAVALPRPNNLGFDYLGVIVALIAIATALAVGFQIWNALSFETRLKELKGQIETEYIAKMDSLEKRLKKDYNNRVANLSMMNAFSTSITFAEVSIINKQYTNAFMFYMRALESETIISESSDIDLGTSCVPMLKTMIDSIPVCITDKEEQKYIIKTIIDSGKEELIEKIGLIKSKIFKSEHTQE